MRGAKSAAASSTCHSRGADRRSYFLVNELGCAFTANGFGNKMRQRCDEADCPIALLMG